MKSAGSTFGSEIWAKHSIVGPMFGKDQFTCLVVRSRDAASAEQLAKFLSSDYRPAVRAEPETTYYEKLSETNKQFSIAIYFVTIIMAIGGVFGVMNTMFAAISQRTKDIGMLRILGFARWQVLVRLRRACASRKEQRDHHERNPDRARGEHGQPSSLLDPLCGSGGWLASWRAEPTGGWLTVFYS